MANSRSAKKQIRASERKRIRNRAVRSAVRTRINTVRRSLIAGENTSVEDELKAAVKALDKAAEKGILHRNNARRRKARIAAMAARLLAPGLNEEELAAARTIAAGGVKGKTARGTGSKSRAKTLKSAPAAKVAAKPAKTAEKSTPGKGAKPASAKAPKAAAAASTEA